MGQKIKQTALQKLSAPPSQAALYELISWLDTICTDDDPAGLEYQLLSRAMLAMGVELLCVLPFTAQPNVRATIDMLETYILEPCERTYDGYTAAATNSYPFGAGDGCFAVPALGFTGCERGSGCRSGAGSLASLPPELEAGVVFGRIATELIPWLTDESDPVEDRILNR